MPPVRLDLGEGLLRQAWASDDALAMRLDPVKCARGLRNVGLGENGDRAWHAVWGLLVVRRSKENSTKARRRLKGDDACLPLQSQLNPRIITHQLPVC